MYIFRRILHAGFVRLNGPFQSCMIEYSICSSGTASGVTGKFSNISGEVPWKMAHERERVSDQSSAEKSLSLIVNNFCKAKPLLKDVH